MSTLQDLIASLSADGFTADEGQQIINAAGGNLQSISDASGVSLDDINSFISANNLQLPVANNNNNDGALDLSNLTGLLNYDPYTVPQGSMPSSGGSGSSGYSSSDATNKQLTDIASTTYNTLNQVKNASAVQAAVNAGDLAAGSLFLPGLGLFMTAINLMGIFDKKGSLEETPYTTDVAIDLMETAISNAQQQTTSSADPNVKDTEGVYSMDDTLMGDLQDTLKKLYAQKAEEEGAYDPEGFVRDEQGFLRDRDTGGYWILTDTGALMRTTPPLVPVPMPEDSMTTGGGGGGSISGGGSGGSDSGGSSGGGGSTDGGGGAIGDWVYDADAGVFRQTGGTETIIPKDGSYSDGDVISNEEMSNIFDRWGDLDTVNRSETPSEDDTDGLGVTIGSGSGNGENVVEDVIDILTRPTPTVDNGGLRTNGTGGGEPVNYQDIADGDSDLTDGDTDFGGDGGGLSGDGGAGNGSGDGTGDGSGTGDGTGGGGTDSGGSDGQGSGDGTGDGTGTGTGTGSGTGSGNGSGEGQALAVRLLTTPIANEIFGDQFVFRDVIRPEFIGLLNLIGRR